MRVARATVILAVFGTALGLVEMLRMLYAAGLLLSAFKTPPPLFLVVGSVAATAVLGVGAVLLYRRQQVGRISVIGASAVLLVILLVEWRRWGTEPDTLPASRTDYLFAVGLDAPHRWVWLVVLVATLVLAALPATGRWCLTPPESQQPSRGPLTVTTAVLAALAAGYALWLGNRQRTGWEQFIGVSGVPWRDDTALLTTTLSAAVVASVVSAVLFLVGAALLVALRPTGRWLIVSGGVLMAAFSLFTWTHLNDFLYDLGAADITSEVAPHPVVWLLGGVILPAVITVLALTSPSASTPR